MKLYDLLSCYFDHIIKWWSKSHPQSIINYWVFLDPSPPTDSIQCFRVWVKMNNSFVTQTFNQSLEWRFFSLEAISSCLPASWRVYFIQGFVDQHNPCATFQFWKLWSYFMLVKGEKERSILLKKPRKCLLESERITVWRQNQAPRQAAQLMFCLLTNASLASLVKSKFTNMDPTWSFLVWSRTF